jgi:hypothetical protein
MHVRGISFIDSDDEGDDTQLVLEFRDVPAFDVRIWTWEFQGGTLGIEGGIDFYDSEDDEGLYQIGIGSMERLIELFNEHKAKGDES